MTAERLADDLVDHWVAASAAVWAGQWAVLMAASTVTTMAGEMVAALVGS
jgi:hypothetical protein